MKRSRTLGSLAAVIAFATVGAMGAFTAGCKDDKKVETAPSATPSAVASAAPSASASAAPSASAAVAADDDTATEEDFEDEADNSITEKNIDDELAKLESELK